MQERKEKPKRKKAPYRLGREVRSEVRSEGSSVAGRRGGRTRKLAEEGRLTPSKTSPPESASSSTPPLTHNTPTANHTLRAPHAPLTPKTRFTPPSAHRAPPAAHPSPAHPTPTRGRGGRGGITRLRPTSRALAPPRLPRRRGRGRPRRGREAPSRRRTLYPPRTVSVWPGGPRGGRQDQSGGEVCGFLL